MKVVIEGNKVTIRQSYDNAREKYLSLIKEANLLGELDEVKRLQGEWAEKRQKLSK